MEGGECFPLLEPEPVREPVPPRENHDSPTSVPRFRSKERKPSIEEPLSLPQIIANEEDCEDPEVDSRNPYQSDCPTCQRNWDLLNRNQRHTKAEHGPVNSDGEAKASLISPTRLGDSTPVCLSFDLDGLLPSVDRQQVRLGQILATKEVCYFPASGLLVSVLINYIDEQAELDALRRDLHQTRVALCRQVCHTCQSSRRTNSKSHSVRLYQLAL